MYEEVSMLYGQKVRVRVCGLCWSHGNLLMVNHTGVNGDQFWAPPGGGIEIGQTAYETLIREFYEETAIVIKVGKFKFVCE